MSVAMTRPGRSKTQPPPVEIAEIRVGQPGGGDRDPHHPEGPAAERDPVADIHPERLGERALDHNAAALTQVPAVTFGWSSDAGAWARPSTSTSAVRPRARTTAEATGYGPL